MAALALGCGGKGGPAAGPGGGGGDTGGGDTGGGDTGGGDTGGGDATEPQAVGHPRNDLIARDMFFGNPERGNVQISPDGKQLSWLAPKDGVMNVWVAPAGDLTKAKAVTADATRPVRMYFWAFTGKHLLYLQDQGGDENFHVFRVELDTDKVTDLTPIAGVRAEVLALSHRKPTKVLVGLNDRNPQLFDVWEVDLTSGDKKLVEQNDDGFIGYVFDDDLAVRFAQKMEPDGTMVVLAPAKKPAAAPKKDAPPASRWTEFDRIGGDDMMTTNILGFDKKATSYYAMDSRGRNTAALYKVDIKTKKKKLILEDKRADIGQVLMHPTENTVQAVGVEWDRHRWQVVDKKIKGDLAAIAKLGDGDISVNSRTLDDKTWIIAIDSDHQSTQYFRWTRAKKTGEFLFSARPAIDDLPLSRMHPVVIKSRDGLDLVSYLSLPVQADPDADGTPTAPVPMVLLVHGGPWGRDGWGYNPLHQLLTNRGYAVLAVNFRGSTGLGKDFTNAGDKQWGKKMHDDLLDAVTWAVDAKITPADQVCIMGGSYGGYATLAGLTLTPDTFACGVDIVGPSSIITLLETIPPYWAPMIAVFKTRVGDFTTAEGKAALLEVSPLTHAANIKKPLLIGQGANDPRVKQTESDQIVKAMQAKKIPVTYVVFPDEGHGFARPENNMAFFAVAEAFLSAHLGGSYLPITAGELSATTMKIEAGRNGVPGLPVK